MRLQILQIALSKKEQLYRTSSRLFWPILLAFITTGSSFIGLAVNPPLDPLSIDFISDAWEEKKGAEIISLMFTGDIMLDRYIKTLRQRNGGDFPFTYMPEVIAAIEEKLGVNELDLIVGNLE